MREKYEIKKAKGFSDKCVMLEGRKLLLDALNSNRFHFEQLFFTDKNEVFISKILNTSFKNTTLRPQSLVKLSHGQAEILADCATTDGLIGSISSRFLAFYLDSI